MSPFRLTRVSARPLIAFAAIAICSFFKSDSLAESVPSERAAAGTATVLGIRGSVAWLRHSRSLALTHLSKPGLRLEALRLVGQNWSLGGALSGLATTDKNYGVWSAQLRARYHWPGGVAQSGVQWGVAFGLGLVQNAPILEATLNSGRGVRLLRVVAVDAQWQWADNLWWGLEIETEQLATLHLGLLLRVGL